ncbi:MAG: proline--tRNA ligase [Dehalococcoidales bacterium]|nr:proline--tRNA ligase [Dehalococcoidales bacterium]
MRVSKLFGKTLREVPAEADTISHRLLLRAGMVDQLAAGVYSYLPLGWRVINKIENIVRDEMNKAGGQELCMPVLQPLEIWQQTGRDQAFGEGLFVLTDRRDRKLVLGPTHEEIITYLASRNVQSYRDLPLMLYQLQTKFRDEPRSRGGLIRVREFIMKDLYSFDTDDAALDVSYQKMLRAYENLYARCGLTAMMVQADSGAIGGKDSHEFMVLAESGEDEIIYCPACKYAANVEKATSVKTKAESGVPLPLEEVATPGAATIEEVANFFKVAPSQTLKAVFYVADGGLVFVVIRGDIEVNEIKLKNLLHATDLRLATDAEVREAGLVKGAASAVGLKGIKIVADDSITSGTNFIAGGNKPEVHLRNVNYPRDFKVDIMGNIARSHAGEGCPSCAARLASIKGIEVGHIFKLGTAFSKVLGANFIDEQGVSKPAIMGCYGIGIGRLLAAAIEQNHDDKGITWPMPIAPYQVYLCPLYREGTKVAEIAEKLYAELEAAGLEVLFDDRQESPGVKFNDADLLGIPIRITVSPRTLEKNSVEFKPRREKQSSLLPMDDAVAKIKEMVAKG